MVCLIGVISQRLGSFKLKVTELFQTLISRVQFCPLFYYSPLLSWYFFIVCITFRLLTDTYFYSYFTTVPVPLDFPLSCSFTVSQVSCKPLVYEQQLLSPLIYMVHRQFRGIFGLCEGIANVYTNEKMKSNIESLVQIHT